MVDLSEEYVAWVIMGGCRDAQGKPICGETYAYLEAQSPVERGRFVQEVLDHIYATPHLHGRVESAPIRVVLNAASEVIDRRTKNRDVQAKEQFMVALLGSDCPAQERRLFDCLSAGRIGLAPGNDSQPRHYGAQKFYLRPTTAVDEQQVICDLYENDPLLAHRAKQRRAPRSGGTDDGERDLRLWRLRNWPPSPDEVGPKDSEEQDRLRDERDRLAAERLGRWLSLAKPDQERLRARLRKLQSRLDDRLAERHVPLCVVRPGPGLLLLLLRDTAEPDALAEADGRVRRQSGKPATGATTAYCGKMPAPPDLQACTAFLLEALTAGPRESEWLKREWARRGGRPTTLRRALKAVDVRTYHEGGSSGKWWKALPAAAESQP